MSSTEFLSSADKGQVQENDAPSSLDHWGQASQGGGGGRQRRVICPRCERPHPRACLCAALPEERLALQRCRVLVLQHPHEVRRKNRSLFLAEFCLSPESIACIRSRRLLHPPQQPDDDADATTLASLLTPDRTVWIVYPHPQAKSLSKAMSERKRQQQQSSVTTPLPPLTLIFLDATWKFAAEMERGSQFPSHAQYIGLEAAHDLLGISPRRFDIRTPPSPQHLSTAECLALVVSRVEENPEIYDTIMKPLDLMVSQWHSFADAKSKGTVT